MDYDDIAAKERNVKIIQILRKLLHFFMASLKLVHGRGLSLENRCSKTRDIELVSNNQFYQSFVLDVILFTFI